MDKYYQIGLTTNCKGIHHNPSNYEKHREHLQSFRERITRKQAAEFGLINENLKMQQKMKKQKTTFSKFLRDGKSLYNIL
jgi:hypothetical protein